MDQRNKITHPMKMLLIMLVALWPADIFTDLGITEKEAQRNIWSSFEKGKLYIPPGIVAKRVGLKSLVLSSRKQLIRDFGRYVKEYISSEAFSKQYDEYRAAKMPAAPSKPDDGLKRIEEENRK